MTPNKLLFVLSRPEVKEVTLRAGRQPVAMMNGVLRPAGPEALSEDALIALLAALSGREHILGIPDGARRWKHEASSGTVHVQAGYEGTVLKAVLRFSAKAAEPAIRKASRRPPALRVEEAVSVPPRAARERDPRAASVRPRAPSVRPSVPSVRPRAAAASERPKRISKRPVPLDTLSEPPVALPMKESAPLPTVEWITEADPDAPETQPAPAMASETDGLPLVSLGDAFNFEPDAKPWAAPLVQEREPVRAPPRFVGDALGDLLGQARARRATDLHVLADRPPMLRVAGELVQLQYSVSAEQAEQLILPRVPASQRAALERDGSCDFAMVHEAYGRFRANVTRQRTGIKLTARPIGDRIPTLAELGLPESIARATDHHQGLIVITGPTGHGKTTTLNAIVGIINERTKHHVITVEDPVEYVHPKAQAVISQREVGTHTKSFQAALKGSLREDPDVIVVGELRDTETVRMAISASETGHLVISTMNTPSAAKTIDRLIDLFPPGDQPQVRMTLAGGLRLVVSQRLLPNAERTGLCVAAEILPGNMPLWNLIRENRTYQIASLQQRGKAMGIVRLDEALAQLVRTGRTTLEIAKSFAEQPEHIEPLSQGKSVIQRPEEPPQAPNMAQRAANQAAKSAAGAVAAATPKKAAELGKSMLSRAGKLFGNDG
jgi:twitching motility protein PilT